MCVIQACNQRGTNTTTENTDSISSADSLNAIKDTSPKLNVPADKNDAQFVVEAAKGCMAEAAMGKLALHQAQNKRVKNFGAMMIKDIARAEKRIAVLAKGRHITLPVVPDTIKQKTIDSLSRKTGKDFDNAYVDNVIKEHNRYLNMFENTSKTSNDPEIKSFANRALRILKNHMEAIHTIHDSMK
ncbi:MAG: putative rane protein [Mucilaginibacter sp.]|nr:putative rane protein [Mucilaginibacter sp.]